jgi:two-component system response regulator MprA
MVQRILLVEDDPKVADLVRWELDQQGYAVEVAHDGESGLAWARRDAPDLLILDVVLPRLSGLEICRQLRAEGDTVPILMLTGRDAVPDRVAGLDAGADDYLVKPFAMEELVARVRALLRRHLPPSDGQVLRLADLTMNTATREVRRGRRLLNLTAREFDLLELFLRHPRQVLTRDVIHDHVWGYGFGGESNVIEVYVRYVRAKLEAGGESRLLQTVRGVGYVLRED